MHDASLQRLSPAAPRRRPPLGSAVRQAGKWAAGRLSVGLNGLLARRATAPVGILTYHRIADHVPRLPQPLYNVTPKRFRRQLAGLLDRGYSVWPLCRVLEHGEAGKDVPPRTAVVTFDDGYESVYTNAWPVLRDLNVPATLFLSTAYLDQDAPFPFDRWGAAHREAAPAAAYRPLREWQCREMADGGLVDLGAHTHTHQDFRNRPDEFRRDLQRSVDELRRRFAEERVTFAFPYGKPDDGFADEAMMDAARQTGVVCGLTTEMVGVAPCTGPFGWGRFNVDPWDTPPTLDAKLSGWYGWAPALNVWLAQTSR
jgi:peptidoglycan/xylan/chitin deacetylase (PgdA/CDA1 family)